MLTVKTYMIQAFRLCDVAIGIKYTLTESVNISRNISIVNV